MWFVWKYIVDYFSKENEIIAYNRDKEATYNHVSYKKWDIRYPINEPTEFDIFIHSASDTWYEKSRGILIENNILSNKNVIDYVNSSRCKHFVYISSSSVYQWISWIIVENAIIDQENLKNSYSYSKYMAEEYIRKNLNKNIKLTILRPRAIYWIWDKVLEPNILKYTLFNRLLLPWNGKNVTSLISIESFIQSIDDVIKYQVTNYEIFNVSEDRCRSMLSIYWEVARKYNKSGIIHIPIIFLYLLYPINRNKYSYLIDTFRNDKILDISKVRSLHLNVPNI